MAKPIVDGIEKQLDGRARLLRVEASSVLGKEIRERFGLRGRPATVLVDHKGAALYSHTGFPRRSKILAAVNQLSD